MCRRGRVGREGDADLGEVQAGDQPGDALGEMIDRAAAHAAAAEVGMQGIVERGGRYHHAGADRAVGGDQALPLGGVPARPPVVGGGEAGDAGVHAVAEGHHRAVAAVEGEHAAPRAGGEMAPAALGDADRGMPVGVVEDAVVVAPHQVARHAPGRVEGLERELPPGGPRQVLVDGAPGVVVAHALDGPGQAVEHAQRHQGTPWALITRRLPAPATAAFRAPTAPT